MASGNYLMKIWKGKKCVFCGGNRVAEGPEHAPPKVMFKNKSRPMGLEFPACHRCNHGSGGLDQLAANIAFGVSPEAVMKTRSMSAHELKVVKGIANNTPNLYISAKRVPIFNQDGKLIGSAVATELRKEISLKLAKWATKQTLALWFEHTGQIASHRVVVDVELLTNTKHPPKDLYEIIKYMGKSDSLNTANRFTADQFSYKIKVDPAKDMAMVFAQYHQGFAFFSIIKDKPIAKLSRKGLDYKFGTNANKGIHQIG
nr:hypothetical protein [Amylibacter sp.]